MSDVALVTGASSGIGEEFARALSARGYELVLVARRTERLERLAGELPGKAHAVACDLAAEAAALPDRVRDLGLDVDLLVNNAGFGTSGPFLDIEPGRDAELVRVNCEALVVLTRAFLPRMVEQDHGGVITVASTAGMQPLPYEAVYSASKAFARHFSDALHEELRNTGVRVLAVHPGPVRTEWQQVAGYASGEPPPGVPSMLDADQVVAESLAAFDRGRRSVVPGAAMRWYMRVNAPVPETIKLRVTERMYRSRHRS